MHLTECSNYFVPNLNSYVNIKEYAFKLATKSMRFELFKENKLKGLLAIYMKNDNEAFITNLSIDIIFQGESFGKKLLQIALKDLKEKGCSEITLEVFKINEKAINFYLKNKFEILSENEAKLLMKLRI